MAARANKQTAARKKVGSAKNAKLTTLGKRYGDGPPVTFPDNSGRPPTECNFNHDKGFTSVVGGVVGVAPFEYRVNAAADEGSVLGEVDVPGIDPEDITQPWRMILGNGVILRAFGDDVIELAFPTKPVESGNYNGKPTKLAHTGKVSSVVVIPSSNIPKSVTILPGDQVRINLETQNARARRF